MYNNILSKKSFTKKDLLWFAERSGDYNPIHLNEEISRRCISGEIIVPGMYLLLWALNNISKIEKKGLSKINATFHHVATLNDNLELSYKKDLENFILSIRSGIRTIATIRINFFIEIIKDNSLNGDPPKNFPKDIVFNKIKNLSGELKSYLNKDCMKEFKFLEKYSMHNIISSLMAFSRLVGMEVPGLNSLFIGINIDISKNYENKKIKWSVVRHTNINSLILLSIKGNGINGRISTMFRPLPVNQPNITDIYKKLKKVNFKGKVALIIGGSRGLGEYTAKMLASSGALVIITYSEGENDAIKIKNEINKFGSTCYCIKMNVTKPTAAFIEIKLLNLNITHVYYFASPKIKESRNTNIDKILYKKYLIIYVEAFKDIIKLMCSFYGNNFILFYPSTIYATEGSNIFKEYINAKLKAEKEISILNGNAKKDFIYSARLPRLFTDQNPNLSIKDNNNNLKLFTDEILTFNKIFTKEK